MGGSMELGNVTAAAEFNIYVDPHAARVVFEAGAPIVMLGLDVTHKALVTDERLAAIQAIGTPVATACAGLLDFFNRYDKERYHIPGAPLHDPCVIAYLLRPELFRGQMRRVEVETEGTHTSGRTVVDWWRRSERPANALVINDVDSRRLLRSADRAPGAAVRVSCWGNNDHVHDQGSGGRCTARRLPWRRGAGAQDQPAAADQAKTETLEAAVRTLTAETSSQRSQLEGLQAELAARDAAVQAARADVAARDRPIQDADAAGGGTARARAAAREADLAAAQSLGGGRGGGAAGAERPGGGRGGNRGRARRAAAGGGSGAGGARRADRARSASSCWLPATTSARRRRSSRSRTSRSRPWSQRVGSWSRAASSWRRNNLELTQQCGPGRAATARRSSTACARSWVPTADKLLEGNRFVFPTDVAFESGSARLTPTARAKALELGRAIAAARRRCRPRPTG